MINHTAPTIKEELRIGDTPPTEECPQVERPQITSPSTRDLSLNVRTNSTNKRHGDGSSVTEAQRRSEGPKALREDDGTVPMASAVPSNTTNVRSSPFSPSLPIILTLLFLLLFTIFPPTASANVLHFPDANLEQAIRDELGQQGGVISRTDMRRLVSLDASRREISDLSGLEHASRLETLNLHQNRIKDISTLQNLTRLQSLYLGDNLIKDLSPLERMSRLETLHLGHNPIVNIEVVQRFRRLTELRLEGTPLKDLTPLGQLNRLGVLYLDEVSADFSSLQKLSQLKELSLAGCEQEDLSFLKVLLSLTHLDLQANNLEDISFLAPLTRLAWLSLENNNITDISSLTRLARLNSLNLRNNDLEDIAPLQQLAAPDWIDIRDNYLDLADNSASTVVIESLQEKNVEVFFEPQKLPFYRGNGLVRAPAGSGGKLLRTPPENRFTLLNPGLGWRIKSFTVAHEGGKPLDFIAEIGRPDPFSRFSWNTLSRANPISVGDKFPHTMTIPGTSDTSIALGVQIWPGYADDSARLFYFSAVHLENIYTGDTYILTLDPDSTGNYSGNTGPLATRRDYDQLREAADLPELQQTIAAALKTRDPALSVIIPLPRGVDLEGELEDIFENIYVTDDYLRYSMQRKSIEWSRQAEETTINFRFHYHATGEEEEIVDNRVQGILENIITPQMDDHQITRAIHDFIVANVAYDQSRRAHSAYAALVQGRAVCQGYALLAQKMLSEAGITVRIISGQAGGENHAWNLVSLDGNWYHLDTTWNDPVPDVPGRILYDFYNRTDTQMRPTHTWDEAAYPSAVTPYTITW